MTGIYVYVLLLCLLTVAFVLEIISHNYVAATNTFLIALYVIKDLSNDVENL